MNKRKIQNIFAHGAVQWMVAGLAAFLIWVIFFTSRISIKNKKILKEFKNKPVIFAFWHGRSMMLSPLVATRGYSGYAVVSNHRDGKIMAKVQRLFRLRSIWGSSSKNSILVLREGLKVLKDGKMIVISPDGPRGPRMRLREGILYFAKITGTPIVPICFSCSRPVIRRSWDRYMICKPFNHVRIDVGNPVYVSRNVGEAEFEAVRLDLEETMVEQLQKLDASFGHEKIIPAEYKK